MEVWMTQDELIIIEAGYAEYIGIHYTILSTLYTF